VTAGVSGTVNTGSGGGAGGFQLTQFSPGGAGGSGVVIISYPSTFQITGGAGLTFSTAAVGANHVTTFTAGTGTIQLVPAQQAFVLLESVVLTSQQASVEFTNLLSKYGANYEHLQIRWVGQTFSASGADITEIGMRLNGDTGTNYGRHLLYGTPNTNLTSAATLGITHLRVGMATKSTQTSIFSGNVIDVADPFSSSKHTTIKAFGGYYSANVAFRSWIGLESGAWYNTAAVTSLTLFSTDSQNFMPGSRFSLYGIRGS
jgi:hypothetical protein